MGGPAPCGRRRALRFTRFARAHSNPCRDGTSGRCRHNPFWHGEDIRSRRRRPYGLAYGCVLVPFQGAMVDSTIPLPMIGGNGTSTAPPASIIIHSARVLKGRTPSNLRQGLLRPQSGVGTRNCKGVLKARYSSFSRNSRPFAVKKLINNLLTGFQQRENLVSCPLSIKKCKF